MRGEAQLNLGQPVSQPNALLLWSSLYHGGQTPYHCGHMLDHCGQTPYHCGQTLYHCGQMPYHCGQTGSQLLHFAYCYFCFRVQTTTCKEKGEADLRSFCFEVCLPALHFTTVAKETNSYRTLLIAIGHFEHKPQLLRWKDSRGPVKLRSAYRLAGMVKQAHNYCTLLIASSSFEQRMYTTTKIKHRF